MEQSTFGMGIFAGFRFGMDPPGDIQYKNQHTQFSVAIDPRYQPEQGEPLPWVVAVRVRIGPTYRGETRAEIAVTAAHSTYGPLQPIIQIDDATLSVHPVGLY